MKVPQNCTKVYKLFVRTAKTRLKKLVLNVTKKLDTIAFKR